MNKITYTRGSNTRSTLAAAATLVFAGFFILLATFPFAALAVINSPVVDPLSFTVIEGEEYSSTLTATYDGSGTVSFNVEQAPYFGSLLLNADGTFTYKAYAQDQTQWPGTTDSFSITATADGLTSAPETVQISITPMSDVTPPVLQSVEVYNHFGEVSGDDQTISVSLHDYRSNVAEMCLWIGDEEANLLPGPACKDISERDGYSYEYAPSFQYRFDSRLIRDGTHTMYVYARDKVGNAATSTAAQTITVNNVSRGSALAPVIITTCSELQAINDHPGWHYELGADIDCVETHTWKGGKGLKTLVIGTELLGHNHIISNVYMNTEYTGVMQIESGAMVHGVNLRDVDLTCGETYCGGFAHNIYGTVDQSSITGTLNCNGKCGGFASQHSGLIKQSWAGLTINGGNGMASGFAGHSLNGQVQNSYFRGHLSTGNGGGIIGLNDGWNGVGMVDTSYAANTFQTGSFSEAGGLIGWQYKGDQARSYWDVDLSGLDQMCGQAGINCQDDHGLTTSEMKTRESFDGWDFEDTWAIDPTKNDGYPYLRWQTSFYAPQHSDPDTTPPVITLLGEAEVTVALSSDYTDAGATAMDDRDGVVDVTVTGSVDTSTAGTYTLTYTASDEAGNESTLTRRVVVAEAEPVATTRRSSGTRIGFRQLATPPGQVLGASLNAEEAQLERYRELVRLLQQLVELLLKLEAMK